MLHLRGVRKLEAEFKGEDKFRISLILHRALYMIGLVNLVEISHFKWYL